MQAKEGQRGKRRSIRGVVFDMDGTLTVDGLIDFPALKRAAGCPPGVDVLAYLASLAGAERKKAEQVRRVLCLSCACDNVLHIMSFLPCPTGG